MPDEINKQAKNNVKNSFKIVLVFAVITIVAAMFVGGFYAGKFGREISAGSSTDPNPFWGGTNTSVNVGPYGTAASSTVLEADTGRQYAIIVNHGDYEAYLKFGYGATTSSPIRLNAGGGSLEIISGENLYTGIVSGIASGGTSTLGIYYK